MTQTSPKNSPNSSLLKETRISKGLTLDIVHEATKIPMDVLKAIEEGYSIRILTPFYYRGFVKIYSEFLGLKVADVLKEYNVQPSEVKIVPKYIKSTPKAAVQTPNVLIEQTQEFWRILWTTKTRNNLLRIAAAIVALIVFVKVVGCVAGAIKSRPKNSKTVVLLKNNKKVSQVKKEQFKEEARIEEEEPVKEAAKIIVAQAQNRKVTLAVHASKDTSIQIKVDGKIVFQMTMKKGTVENWEANNEIELSGKNIGSLDLEVNGKDISSLSSANRRAKSVVITKDGLTVKK